MSRNNSQSDTQPLFDDPYGYSRSSDSISGFLYLSDDFEIEEDTDEIIDAVDHVFVPPNPGNLNI